MILIRRDDPDLVRFARGGDFAENQPGGSVLGTIAVGDPHITDIPYYWIPTAADNELFAVDGDLGIVTALASFDFEAQSSYSFRVEVYNNYEELHCRMNLTVSVLGSLWPAPSAATTTATVWRPPLLRWEAPLAHSAPSTRMPLTRISTRCRPASPQECWRSPLRERCSSVSLSTALPAA